MFGHPDQFERDAWDEADRVAREALAESEADKFAGEEWDEIPVLSDAELYAAEACIEAGNTDPMLVAMVEETHRINAFIERNTRYDDEVGF